MKRTSLVWLTLCSILHCFAAVSPLPESISEAQWLWSEPQKNPPMTAFLRYEFEINAKVKRAYFYAFWDKRGKFFLNGNQVQLRLWTPLKKYRGHVKGSGIELAPLLKPGKNVLAIRLERNNIGCFGVMLRGEIEYENGTKQCFCSSGKYFKASGTEQKNWNMPGFDDSKWAKAREQGDVRMEPWSKYGNVEKIYCTPAEYQTYIQQLAKVFPEKKLKNEPADPQCKIVYSGMIPSISINGRTIAPYSVSVKVKTPQWCSMVPNYAKIGINIFSIGFPVDAIYTGNGKYDMSFCDPLIRQILSLNPDARFLLCPHCAPPKSWIARNPDELVGYAVKNDRRENDNYASNAVAPSFASKAFREERSRMLCELGAYCRKQPWGRRIIGIHLPYGPSNDGMPWGCHCMPDNGKRMTEAFRRFLAGKYQTDGALQKSWCDSKVTLKTANVPDRIERSGAGGYLKNPGEPRDRRVSDYYEAYHKEFADFMLHIGKAAKEAFPGRLVGSYFGYMILSYEPEGSSANFEPLLKSPYYDYLWATTRGYNLTDGLPRHLFSVFRRYGKLAVIEGDIRTYHGRSEAEKQWTCRSPEETRSTFQKLIGNSIFYGGAWEAPDFGNNFSWFNAPESLEPLAKSMKIWRKLFNNPPKQNAEVAVILSPEQIWKQGTPYYGRTSLFSDNLLTFPLQTLNFSGIPYDLLAPEDFIASKHSYKAVIFLNQFVVAKELKKPLLKKLRQKGVTTIWNYAPGLLAPQGYSSDAMTELTGIKLNFSTELKPFAVKLQNGKMMQLFGTSASYKESPRVCSTDDKAEKLGVYIDDNSGALVRKKLDDGSIAVFAGLPVHEPELWAELLKNAGCHAYTAPGFYVKRNSQMLMVFSGKNTNIPPESRIMKGRLSQSGVVTVMLPQKVKRVTDCFTGEILARDTRNFTLKSDQPHTWLMTIE